MQMYIAVGKKVIDSTVRRQISIHSLKRKVDLRSDTVTKPSSGMLAAMNNAKVGDDVYKEDPTVIELEHRMANLAGMEAGLFVPSGTMGNLISLGMHCQRGQEILIGDKSHIFYFEGGGASVHLGLAFHTVPNNPDGTIPINSLEAALRPANIHFAPTRLVSVENSHNITGGMTLTPTYMKSIAQFAAKHQLKLHVDGARIFNAVVAQKVELKDLLPGTDSASICISKGLGCAIGSVVVGNKEDIARARRLRKSLGGGMRQAGYLAAAGLFALDHNIHRLQQDHDNAKLLAQLLAKNEHIDMITVIPETNIVVIGFRNNDKHVATRIVSMLQTEYNIQMNAMAGNRIRAVTHLDVDQDDIVYAATAVSNVVSKM